MKDRYDVIIVGTGVSGCFAALQFPREKKVLMITKKTITESDSYIAQGGICTLKDDDDYEDFYEDTLKAGHYENDPQAVSVMIDHSKDIIGELLSYGVEFAREEGSFCYTREGAHSTPRILYHKDVTGEEITKKLIAEVEMRDSIDIRENTTLVDLLVSGGECVGIVVEDSEGAYQNIYGDAVILATGGVGGLFEQSTNFEHLTGDSLRIAKAHRIALKNENYVQIHPTTLYSKEGGRRFLISESIRGEGGLLFNKAGERFVEELLPRDLLAKEIYQQMAKDNSPYVWLSMQGIEQDIKVRFPNIYKRCLEEGYNPEVDWIPVVPAQHYFMGGIKTDLWGRTSMPYLYGVGETSCNGVHGANRLASNSLLESLVFSKRAAQDIIEKKLKRELPELPVSVGTIGSAVKRRYSVKEYLDKGGGNIG